MRAWLDALAEIQARNFSRHAIATVCIDGREPIKVRAEEVPQPINLSYRPKFLGISDGARCSARLAEHSPLSRRWAK
jgi:hypothetical protein